jgi:predicted DNA binding CopG/RHH family protein
MSEEKKRKPIKLIDDPSELPTDLSDEEQLEFWETHGLSEEFLDKTEEVPAEERPQRSEKAVPISVRFDAHTLDRLKTLADHRGIGYQTLLKQFVGERLYEEEKREGLIPASNAAASEEESWPRRMQQLAAHSFARGMRQGLPRAKVLSSVFDQWLEYERHRGEQEWELLSSPVPDTNLPYRVPSSQSRHFVAVYVGKHRSAEQLREDAERALQGPSEEQ